MAKKTIPAKAAKKPAKPAPAAKKAAPAAKARPAKPAKSAKPAAKPAKPAPKAAVTAKAAPKASKPAQKPAKSAPASKKVVKTVPAKKAAKPASKKPETKPVSKTVPAKKTPVKTVPAKKAEPVSKAKAEEKKTPAKAVVAPKAKVETKPAARIEPKQAKPEPKPAVKVEKKPEEKEAPVTAKKEVEVKEAVAPAAPVKTVEQAMQEKAAPASKSAPKTKEELFVPKYNLPAPAEVVRPMRSKPVVAKSNEPSRPVANPIYVAPGPDGKPGIKFAPVANIERAPEKEKTNKNEDSEDMKTSPRLAFTDGDDKKGGVSVEDKLRALYDIQLIDTRIDKIHAMRGELPLEVEDLESEVQGLETRIENIQNDMKNLDNEINAKKQGIKDSEALIKKYKEQLNNVKNNREFDSLNKETEYQELEIQLHKKRIKEFETQKLSKEEVLAVSEQKLKERLGDLKVKKDELDEIIRDTEKEENILRQKGQEARKLIEERLLSAYERIRSGAPNKMAVVPIEREASAGSFIQLPPQKQLDVAARKRVIVDEHSGRILVDADLAREEQEKMDAILAKELGK